MSLDSGTDFDGLTAHIQPPDGHGGIAAGTEYVVSRFHGVLDRIEKGSDRTRSIRILTGTER